MNLKIVLTLAVTDNNSALNLQLQYRMPSPRGHP